MPRCAIGAYSDNVTTSEPPCGQDATEKAPGQLLTRHAVTVEIEGEEKPALTAVWLGLLFT